MKCPVCNSKKIKFWKEFKSNKIDQSKLYKDIIIYHCENCDHYFNKITKRDMEVALDYCLAKKEKRIIKQDDEDTATFGIIILDHIIEHFPEFNFFPKPFISAINSYDIIEIKCPIVSDYMDTTKADQLYCWLIKEHIQHFSKESILKLFQNFYLQSFKKYNYMTLNDRLAIPSMHLVLTKFNPDGQYYYGAGREFLYDYCGYNFNGIIDDKQFGNTVDGVLIYHSDIVPYLSAKSKINITSWYHEQDMKKQLFEKGFKGTIY